jgi:hypothetical protein
MLTTVRLVTRGRWSEVAVVAMGQDVFVQIQGVFEVEAFLLTCDSMRCSKEF